MTYHSRFLMLHPAQISNWDYVCMVKAAWPDVRIYETKALPSEYDTGMLRKCKGNSRKEQKMPESYVMTQDKICKNSVRYTVQCGEQPFSVYVPKSELTDPPKRQIELTIEEVAA